MKKAFFLDRDGVINYDTGYVHKIEDFKFIESIFEALRYIQSKNYYLFIITNQSGINRGFYSHADFEKLNNFMLKQFINNGITITEVKYCPHIPEQKCLCRKPNIGMIEDLLLNYEIDVKNSWLVGDKDSDMKLAQNVNIQNKIFISDSIKEFKYERKGIINLNNLHQIIALNLL